MQSEPTNILTIQFANEISQHEIPLFRGAVIHSLENKSILFHNHDGDKFRFSYPLIQYKQIGSKATIVCIGKGIESVNELFSTGNIQLRIGEKDVNTRIESIHIDQVNISCNETEQLYKLYNWLPLNSKNYNQFLKTDGLIDKISILERVLTGNILSFLKGMGIHLEEQLNIHITDIPDQHFTNYKKMKLMAFDIEFKANIQLPQYIGIGKNASIGYGILIKKLAKVSFP